MTSLPLVLVTGATGKTGQAAVRSLTTDHAGAVRTRAMVRRDDRRAQALRDAGAEVVIGDMGDVRDLRRAMDGVQRAYFVAPVTAASLDFGINFAIAAAEQELEHIVAISQWLATESHPSAQTRRTWMIDQVVRMIPGAGHTIINVGWFADNFMSMLGTAAQMGMFSAPIGQGATAPISSEDIGRVVAGVLANPTPYAGRTLRPTGPRVLTPDDIASVFTEVLGRPVQYSEASERMLVKSMTALGYSPYELAQIVQYMREYGRGTFELGGTTDVVREVTGRAAEDFETIARRHAASDPMTQRSMPNFLRALAEFAKILLTPAPDLERWERESGLPMIDATVCADHTEWRGTHDVAGAFGVGERKAPVALAR